jgi:1-phosphatidylinositol-4-phosphate 5-kinase
MDNKIMDYSLLVGIHDLSRGNRDHIRDSTLSIFEPNAQTLSRRATATTRSVKAQISKEASQKVDLLQLGPSAAAFPAQSPPE